MQAPARGARASRPPRAHFCAGRLGQLAAGIAAQLRNALAPDCMVCGVQSGDPICAGCAADYFPTDTPRCAVCANPLAQAAPGGNAAHEICGSCLVHPRHFDASLALAHYAPPVDAMIAALKYHGRLDLGRAFGILLSRRAAHLELDGVVPLPLAAPRLRERGYNQAAEIARALAAKGRWPLLANARVRTRHCASQQDLRLEQRRTNVRGAFAATGALLGLRLALVDDVLTSGSTLDEAAAMLKRAGASRVVNLVVARTP